jgi:putative FmdB family regulatory protein
MPTYEYACTRCGNRFEVFQRIEDGPLTVCEACGGPLRKVFHPAGIVFKGSGFYATDSRPKPKAETPSGGDGKKDGKKEGKKDTSTSSGSSTSGAKEKTA